MICLTTEQAQQIEEAMESVHGLSGINMSKPLATIRAARAQEQAEQEPVAILKSSKANFERQFGKQVFADWIYDDLTYSFENAAPQPVQEPLMDYERINALREGEQNGAEDAYFFVRPENDTPSLRKMFCQGFERGFHKGLKYAAHVRTKDLTDDEICEIVDKLSRPHFIDFARAVIAKFKEKNK